MKALIQYLCFFSCFFIIIYSAQAHKNYRYNNEISGEKSARNFQLQKSLHPFHAATKDPKIVVSKPVIITQPKDTSVCNGASAIFYVIAEGQEPLSYAWEVAQRGTGWIPISDDAVYENSSTDSLRIKAADLSMHKYKYRVTITDPYGNFRSSNAQATLYVNSGATIFANPQKDTLCNGETTDITIHSDIPETKFNVEVLYGEMYGASSNLTDDTTIQQTLINHTPYADSVVYRITPSAESNYQACAGIADTVVVWLNPTPAAQVSVFQDTICNNAYTQILLSTENILTAGEVTFQYSSFADDGITGNSSETAATNGFVIEDVLNNSTSLPAHPLVVRYVITPQALSINCSDGPGLVDSITVHPTADIEFSTENVRCYSDSNGTATVFAQNGVNIFTYEWNDPLNQTTSTATNLTAGTYSVTVTDNQNCISIDSVYLTQPDPLIAEIEKSIISCFGANDGAFAVNTFGGTPDYTYVWSNGYTGPVQNMMSPGNYRLTITDRLGCFIDTSLKLIEPGQLIVNPTIRKPTCNDTKDGYIELNISGGRTPYSVYWDNGSIEENLYEIRSGVYAVMIHDSSMCSLDTSFKLIGVHDICIRVPNAFTPNGDSYNELWEIDMKGLYPQAEIEVFDRYGRRVFYSKGYDESQYWDGTYDGKELPIDAYYYVINLKNGSQRLSGTVTIIR